MDNRTPHRKIGDLGEDIAVKFLVKHGFDIIKRNYWKPFGELDIVCQKDGSTHFVEVKTVSRGTNVSQDEYRPEDNIHGLKLRRLGRTIETYLAEFNVSESWEFDVVTVELHKDKKVARVKMISNIII